MTAYFSPCRTWRYSLTRDVAPLTGSGACVFIGLNPSTADEVNNDPTVRRCIGYARDWGYAQLVMLNAYAYRSTDPFALKCVADPVGPENDEVIEEVCGSADIVVAAWGAHASRARAAHIRELAPLLHCLGVTNSGAPKHPLYLRRDATLEPWPRREAA